MVVYNQQLFMVDYIKGTIENHIQIVISNLKVEDFKFFKIRL